MSTSPDDLFADPAPADPDTSTEALPVEHPDYRVRVLDFPLPWSADSLKNPEEMDPAELLTAFVDCKRMADAFSLASKEVGKGAGMLEPYVREIISARKDMPIQAFIGVTPYLIAVERKVALGLKGKKPDIIKDLQGSEHKAWQSAVQAKPDYNSNSLLKKVRDELADQGVEANQWTVENIAAALPPEIGNHIEIRESSSLTFKEQK